MKIDLHVHTSEISLCGHVSARDTVRLYKEAGYDAIVITNHFSADGIYHFAHQGRDDYFNAYYEGYELARQAGQDYGLTVLNGYELRFRRNVNDYLVYGMPDEVAKDYDRIFDMGPREFSQLANEYGFLFYQAHPFRGGMTVVDPRNLFGIEVKNCNPRHDSRNDIAQHWAEKFSLHRIGGSDFHQTQDLGRGGIITDEKVENMADLVQVLKNDKYTLI